MISRGAFPFVTEASTTEPKKSMAGIKAVMRELFNGWKENVMRKHGLRKESKPGVDVRFSSKE